MGAVERSYAQALYRAALDKDRLESVRADLGEFLTVRRETPELRAVLEKPEIDPTTKADLLEGLLVGYEPLVSNFLRLLAEKNRLDVLDEIAREFESLVAAGERRLRVVLTTAHELSDEEADSLVAKIERASGRPVEASRRVDSELIGGLVVEAGSLRLDASVRGRLERLRNELVQTRS